MPSSRRNRELQASGAAEVEAACARYEKKIHDAGGVDLQLLGIGADGHLGLNEPKSSLAARTRIKTLTAQTRSDNARFFHSIDDVPHDEAAASRLLLADYYRATRSPASPGGRPSERLLDGS